MFCTYQLRYSNALYVGNCGRWKWKSTKTRQFQTVLNYIKKTTEYLKNSTVFMEFMQTTIREQS